MSLDVELLRNSFALVAERAPSFTPRFYEILFERYPQAKPLFGNNAPDRQAKMLQESLVAVMDHLEDASWLKDTLTGMGAKHVEYGVTEEMYPWVGDALVATLAEVAGDDWTPEMAQAWGQAYGAISGMMLEGAKAS